MTFFLQDQPSDVAVPARGTDTPLTGLWGGLAAGIGQEQIESNANFRAGREAIRTDDELAVEAARHMGADRIARMVEDFNARARAAGMRERPMPEDLADLPSIFGPNFSKAVLDEARKDPAWAGPDVTPETSEKRTTERLKKEHQDLIETLNTMSDGQRAIAEIAGGIVGAVADIRNLPFLFSGGGGSLARIMGREAMLNVAAETVTLPDRFDMAERLDIPKPDVAMTLAYAAAGGAILGGAVEGLARGITYWRGTRVGKPSDRVASFDQELNADIAEDALADLRHPFERVQAEVVETPKPRPQEAVQESAPEPVRLRDDALPPETPSPRAAPSVSAAEASPAAILRQEPERDLFDQPGARGGVGERQTDLEDLIAEAKARDIPDDEPLPAVVERRLNAEAGGKRPLITHLKNRYGGISPTSRIGEELKAIGITSKSAPGLFRKTGAKGMDNIPASEEPHLAAILGQDGNGYLDELALADAIAEEIGGKPRPVNIEQENALIELNERRRAQEDRDRAASAAYGRELDEALFQMPDVPGWVDVPKEREAIAAYQTDDLRTRIEQEGDRMIGGRSLSSFLDELDADDEFAAIAELCGRRTA